MPHTNYKQICPMCKKYGVRKGCYNRCDQNNEPLAELLGESKMVIRKGKPVIEPKGNRAKLYN